MSLRSLAHVTKGFGETNKDDVYEDFFFEIWWVKVGAGLETEQL
jgi:hypothetical protein